MKLHENNRSFKRVSIRGFSCMLGALTLAVAVSPSAEAQIIPSQPALLNTNGNTDSGFDFAPQVTTDGAGNWVAVWSSSEDLHGTAGTDSDIFVTTSTDNGATWSPPALLNVNGNSDTGSDFNPAVATDGTGNWVAVWDSKENLETFGVMAGTDSDIFVATSTDNGVTWTATALLNTSGTTDSGADRSAQVMTDGAGNWVAVWQSNENLFGGTSTDYDIFVATSMNNGASWTPPDLLNTNGFSDAGRDAGPEVATSGTGDWFAVWHSNENIEIFGMPAGTDNDIFATTSTNNGATWFPPFVLNSEGLLTIGEDFNPALTTDGAGNWVAVWESDANLGGTAGTDDDVFVVTFSDNGANLTATALLNTNGNSDTGDDALAQVTTDGAGNWVAVWASVEDLAGTAGPDVDIFVTTFTIAIGAPGDVNCDEAVTPGDAQAAFDSFLGLSTPDCIDNGDGSVTPGDAQGIFNMFLGLPTPCD